MLIAIVLMLSCFYAHQHDSVDTEDVQTQVDELGEELVEIREETSKLRSDIHYMISEGFEMREDALRMEFKTTIVDTLSILKSQAIETVSFLNEIMNNFDNVKERLEKLELAVEENGKMAVAIKSRQEVMMTEVRLISLYKMTEQSSIHTAGGNDAELAVDGQFVFSQWDPTSPTRTIAHNDFGPSKIWIDLGGLFRIHRIKIWNSRHSNRLHFIGTHIYAGERLVGVATTAEFIYDFEMTESDPLYAQSVTLDQTHNNWLYVLEVQVWGTGPYAEDDKFA